MIKDDQRQVLQESIRLQKEAAGIQQAMEKAVAGQQMVSLQGMDPAGLPILLLKVRVFIRTMQEIEKKSQDLGERIRQIGQQMHQEQHTHQARQLQQRLQSLEVTRILLAQIEAEAAGLAAAYRELEASLVDAGRAMDDDRIIRLRLAAAAATDRIRQAAGVKHA